MPRQRKDLSKYRAKRDFSKTSEPSGSEPRNVGGQRYVIQKHAASRLHFDFRLELDGVLKSWAVTKGPSLSPADKRLAVHVEDHPLEYGSFEGTIPQDQYGGGTVMLWDRGTWKPAGDAARGYAKGNLTFELRGKRLKGRWHLVRMRSRRGETRENWLLIKGHDDYADADGNAAVERYQKSVESGKTMQGIAKSSGRAWGRGGARRRSAEESTAALEALAKKTPSEKFAKTKKAAKTGPAALKSKGRGNVVAGITITHPDRVLWPEEGITKLDLARYYARIAPRFLAHAGDRPMSLVRCPQGDVGQCFFQRHAGKGMSDHVKGVSVSGHGEGKPYIYVDDTPGLVSLVQMGTIELHVWNSTVAAVKKPDRIVFDLDPAPDVSWERVKTAALEVRANLKKLGLTCFLKTTGGKGLHIVLPFKAGPSWNDAKSFARALSDAMAKDAPDRFTINSRKETRKGRIFIDYLRNDETASAVAAYSVRARPGAAVSVPISWDELGKLKSGAAFGMRETLKRRSDPWKAMSRVGKQSLPAFTR